MNRFLENKKRLFGSDLKDNGQLLEQNPFTAKGLAKALVSITIMEGEFPYEFYF
jgi:hypothetical protein